MRTCFKILLYLGLLLPAIARAQLPVKTRGDSTLINLDYRLLVGFTLGIPLYNDTASALHGGKDVLGLIVQIRATGAWYKRDTLSGGGHQWTLVGSGSGLDTTAADIRYLKRGDSAANNTHGFTTQASRQKLADSLQAVFNALLSLKLNSSDSAATNPHGYVTQASRQKLSDSLQAVFNALLAGKVTNAGGVSFFGHGTYASKPTSGTGIWYATDSASFFYINGATATNMNPTFHITVNNLSTGYPLAFGHDSTFDFWTLAPGSNVTFDTTTHGKLIINSTGGGGGTDSGISASNGIIATPSATGPTVILKGDTAFLATRARVQKPIDSLGALIRGKTDTATTDSILTKINKRAYFITGTKNGAVSMTYAVSIGTDTGYVTKATQIISANNSIRRDTLSSTDSAAVFNLQVAPFLSLDSLGFTRFVAFAVPTVMSGFGNSIMAGQGASTTDSAWAYRAAFYWGLSFNNYAVSGSGANMSAKNANANLTIPDATMTVASFGFNDVRYAGNGTTAPVLTYRKVNNGINSVLASHFAKSATAAGLANLYGTWTTSFNAASVGGRFTNGAYTTTVNDSITYNFSDSTVFFAAVGTDSSYGATNYSESVKVYIDNVLVQTISEDNQTDGVTVSADDNRRQPIVFFYHGLVNKAHTLKLVNNSAHGYYMVVDYFGTLQDAGNARPFLWMEAEKLTSGGYGVTPAGASNAIIDSLNSKADSTLHAFPSGYPIYIGKTNNFFHAATDVSSDSIHPSNLGHLHWAQAGEAALPSVLNGGVNAGPSSIYYTGTDFKAVTADGTIHSLTAGSSGPGGSYINASPLSPQNAFINISQGAIFGNAIRFGNTAGTTNSAPAFIAFTGGTYGLRAFQTSSVNYLLSADSTGTNGVPLVIGGRTLDLKYYTTGFGPGVHIDSSGVSLGDATTGDKQLRINTGQGAFVFFDFGGNNILESSNSARSADNPLQINASFLELHNTRTGGGLMGHIGQGDTVSWNVRQSYTGNFGSSFTDHSIPDIHTVDSLIAARSGSSSPILYSQTTAGTAVTNTITQTSIMTGTGTGSLTIPANSLSVGQVITLHGFAKVSTAPTSSLGFNILIGGTGYSAGTTPAASLTNIVYEFTLTFTVTATGASGSVYPTLKIEPAGNISAPTTVATGALTVNTTLGMAVDLQATWGAASTSDSIQILPMFQLKVQ